MKIFYSCPKEGSLQVRFIIILSTYQLVCLHQVVQQNGQESERLRRRELERRRHASARTVSTAAAPAGHDGLVLSAATAGRRRAAIDGSAATRERSTSGALQTGQRLQRRQHAAMGLASR